MDEGELKICDNCKREIPAVNFTPHTVFCARNIRVCPVCKEPVPQAMLQDHHETMHKLLPCKECGESVCGTDLEDHIRDSCANTMKSCKFCLLELRRSAMPAHERYCGARTEQCGDCGEWVMHKYRQLHLDSNHGFIRLDDDPVPTKKDEKATNVPKPSKATTASKAQVVNDLTKNTNLTKPVTQIRYYNTRNNLENSELNTPSASRSETNSSGSPGVSSANRRETSSVANLSRPQTSASTSNRREISTATNTNRPQSSSPSPSRKEISTVANLNRPKTSSPSSSRKEISTVANLNRPKTSSPSSSRKDTSTVANLNRPKTSSPSSSRKETSTVANLNRPKTSSPSSSRKETSTVANLNRPKTSSPSSSRKETSTVANLNRPKTSSPSPSRKETSTVANLNRPLTGASSSNRGETTTANLNRPKVCANRTSAPSAGDVARTNSGDVVSASSSAQNGAIPRVKRTNDQPQVNTSGDPADKVKKNLWAARGATKKRPAPPPPDAADPRPLRSALQRQQREELQRQQQTAYNLSVGLPPVLSPAAKLDKLRKMDALQNPVVDDQEYKNRLQGRVWMNTETSPVGYVLGSSSNGANTSRNLEASRRSGSKSKSPEKVQDETQVRRNDFKDLKPMTPEEFIDRFNELQLRNPGVETIRADRFSQIKSSLRELRRGLNEVTAPYNTNANSEPFQSEPSSPEDSQVRLPCEFCGALVPPDDLVQHQTGCRPDLTQYRPEPVPPRPVPASPRPAPASPRPAPASPRSEPAVFIPCEFCTQPQPVYLLSEHQERCGRESNMLFPD